MPVGVEIRAPASDAADVVVTEEAQAFLADLEREFRGRRAALLERRTRRLAELRDGRLPGFLPETRHVRDDPWRVAPVPDELQDRRVEITGPVDRKMVINA